MTLIRLEVTDSIALVTLDNPPVNSQPMQLIEELPPILDPALRSGKADYGRAVTCSSSPMSKNGF
jgi:enoyl-CoA hydratase/carnithine racemase